MSADNVDNGDNVAPVNVIGAPVLAVRGPFPPDRMKEFLVGVGVEARDEMLAQVVEQEQTLSVGVTVRVDQEGTISGSNLFLSSHRVWEAGYKASHIWEDADEFTTVAFNFPPNSVKFPRSGGVRNVTDWLDASDFMEIKVDDLEIDRREWGDLPGVNRGLSVRFCLTPVAVDTFSLQCFYAPCSLTVLGQLAEAKKINLNSTSVPSGRLNYLTQGYRKLKVAPLLAEDPHARLGLGIVPLLEVDTISEATLLPSRDAIDEELAALLGPSTIFLRYYALDKINKALGNKQWASLMLDPKPVQWPAYRGPTAAPSSGDQSGFDDDDSLMGVDVGMESEDFLQFQQDQSEGRARQQEAEALQSQMQPPQHRGLGLPTGGVQQLQQQRGLQTGGQLLQQARTQQQVSQPVPQQVSRHHQRRQPGALAPPGPVHHQPAAFDLSDAPPDLAKQCMEMSSWLTDSGLSRKEAMDKSMEWLKKQTLQRSKERSQSMTPEMMQLLQGQDSVNRVLAENLTRNAESSMDPLAHTEPDMSLASNKISGTFELEDDSTTKFEWGIRVALKAPNAPMQDYWDQIPNNGAQKAVPRRASSLVLTHLMGTSQVNPQVILMMHDRAIPLTYQMLLSKNAQYRGDIPMVVKTHKMMGRAHTTTHRDWEDTQDSHELVEAVHNYIAIIHHLRPWSPEGHALMRALHNVRYFYNATSSAKEQTTTLKEALVNYFHVVSQRGAQGAAPPDFKEIVKIFEDTAVKQGVTAATLKMGSCYSAQKKSPESGLIARLEAVESWKKSSEAGGSGPVNNNSRKRKNQHNTTPANNKRGGGGGGGGARGRGRGGGRGGGVPHHIIDKIQETCALWNSEAGCSPICPVGLKHQCSFLTNGGTRLCWETDHNKVDHPA